MLARQPALHRPALPARLALILGALIVIAGCSAASAPFPIAQEKPGAAGLDGRSSTGDMTFQVTPGGNGKPATAPEQVTPGGNGKPATAPEGVGDGSQIIRTGSLQLQVADVRAAVDGAKAAVTGLGGFISSSRESGGEEQPVAYVTYRVPADKWDDALAALRKLAVKVVGEQTDSADVSAQLVDIDARLKNLRTAETALQEIAAKATRVSDVLEVQARLTEVRGQIESLAAQQKALKGRVAHATLSVTFGLPLGAISEAAKRWDPAREVDKASASLIELLQGIASAAIWLVIVWLPALLILGIIAWITVLLARRIGLRWPRRPGASGPLTEPPSAPATGA